MVDQWEQTNDELEDDEDSRPSRKPSPRQQMRQLEKDNAQRIATRSESRENMTHHMGMDLG
jgi:hypothetical protein